MVAHTFSSPGTPEGKMEDCCKVKTSLGYLCLKEKQIRNTRNTVYPDSRTRSRPLGCFGLLNPCNSKEFGMLGSSRMLAGQVRGPGCKEALSLLISGKKNKTK